MIPGMNPRKMQQMMKKMGIAQVDIPATEVIIRTEDKEYVFSEPQVSKVNMMGQNTFQVVGEPVERERVPESTTPDINQDDIKTVMEQTGADEEKAKQAILDNEGDLAQAIISLSE